MAMTESQSANKRRIDLENSVRLELARLGKEGTPEELREFYDKHAKEYDEMGLVSSYEIGCRALISALAELVPNRDARILDVAAGSGLVGQELRNFGYDNIDALEPSEKMLDIAKFKKIYKEYIMDTIQPGKMSTLDEDSYDAVCLGGAVLQGHITFDCFPELMRITKKGGVIVFNVADKYLTKEPYFQEDKLEEIFQAFVDNGDWMKWDKRRAPYRYKETCCIFRIVLV